MTYRTTYRILTLLIYLFQKQAFIHIKQGHLQEVTILLNPQDLTNKLNPFQEMVLNIWNSLPCEIRHLYKNHFKIKIHSILTPKDFQKKNDYIDLSVLIAKIY